MQTQWIDWNKPNLSPKRVTLSLGGFDGIHLGHQSLIKQLVKKSRENKTPSVLCLFDPLPFQVLRDIKPFKRLLTLSELKSLLSELELDFLCIIPFNKKISKISPHDFITSFLIPHFEPQHILTGYDFSFAHQRTGDFIFLKSYQEKYGFSLEKAPVFLQKDKAVSSSLIREHLKLGEMQKVRELLGRPFSIESQVIEGEGRGRKLGFPTANLKLDHKEYPCPGVYRAVVRIKKAPTLLNLNQDSKPDNSKHQSYNSVEINPSKAKNQLERINLNPSSNLTKKQEFKSDLKRSLYEKCSFSKQAEESPSYKAVVNIGSRPTFYKNSETLVEVHIPEIHQNLYGQTLYVELEAFLRKEQVFKSLKELKEQIKKDIKKLLSPL